MTDEPTNPSGAGAGSGIRASRIPVGSDPSSRAGETADSRAHTSLRRPAPRRASAAGPPARRRDPRLRLRVRGAVAEATTAARQPAARAAGIRRRARRPHRCDRSRRRTPSPRSTASRASTLAPSAAARRPRRACLIATARARRRRPGAVRARRTAALARRSHPGATVRGLGSLTGVPVAEQEPAQHVHRDRHRAIAHVAAAAGHHRAARQPPP